MKCKCCGQELPNERSLFEEENGRAVEKDAGGNGKARRAGYARTKLDPKWEPDEKLALYAQSKGKDPQAFLERFREHYIASGTRWARWDMVWMKACREWQEPKKQEPARTVYDEPWEQRVKDWQPGKFWSPMWGPRPGQPGCRVPKELLGRVG